MRGEAPAIFARTSVALGWRSPRSRPRRTSFGDARMTANSRGLPSETRPSWTETAAPGTALSISRSMYWASGRKAFAFASTSATVSGAGAAPGDGAAGGRRSVRGRWASGRRTWCGRCGGLGDRRRHRRYGRQRRDCRRRRSSWRKRAVYDKRRHRHRLHRDCGGRGWRSRRRGCGGRCGSSRTRIRTGQRSPEGNGVRAWKRPWRLAGRRTTCRRLVGVDRPAGIVVDAFEPGGAREHEALLAQPVDDVVTMWEGLRADGGHPFAEVAAGIGLRLEKLALLGGVVGAHEDAVLLPPQIQRRVRLL